MSKFFLKSKIAKLIDDRIRVYNEASDGPFPTGSNDDELVDAPGDEMSSDQPDPTISPEPENPENEDGAYISDNKLSMYGSLLLRAYMSQPPTNMPDKFKNVTASNANDVIKFIEDSLEAEGSQGDLANKLSQI